ncbi:hypothetical protein ACFS7Z_25100 [Pontibacter toksunensis]|uniref:Uncharacterized protein n=1 Tax=Pontibacter toksunensis TaxID=1332631 RepID=A0ABW6C0S3_9BACT
MKALNALFYHVYNSYYKDGNYTNDIPHLTAFGLLGSSLTMFCLAVFALFNSMFNNSRLSVGICLAIVIAGLLFFSFQFLYDSRYNRIYNEIKGSKLDNMFMKIVAWGVVVMGFVSVGLYSYIFNQPK